MDPRDNGQGYRTVADGFTRAFEIAAVPAIFGGIGYGLDRWLGFFPWLSLSLFTFAVVGTFVRTWFAYDLEMRATEQQAAWARPTPTRTVVVPPAIRPDPEAGA